MKRLFLFITTNILVLVVVSIVIQVMVNVLGVSTDPRNLWSLLALSAVIGFTGSIISLLMSKWIAKRSTGAHVIDSPRNDVEAWLLNTVRAQAEQWNLRMPEVAIYDSPEPNAYATGASRNRSLIAVSTGLLQHMSKDEVEAVLAHEMAHVGNGDMVTLTLIQGVVNTFVVFLARLVASVVSQALSRDSEGRSDGAAYFVVTMVLQIFFGFLASIVVMWFSRQREYRADHDAARLVGATKMIAALRRLKNSMPSQLPAQMSAMGIASEAKDPVFSTHPTLDNRIARLQRFI